VSEKEFLLQRIIEMKNMNFTNVIAKLTEMLKFAKT